MTIHVVCRDCEAEGLHDANTAGTLATRHARENDHEVTVMAVEDDDLGDGESRDGEGGTRPVPPGVPNTPEGDDGE